LATSAGHNVQTTQRSPMLRNEKRKLDYVYYPKIRSVNKALYQPASCLTPVVESEDFCTAIDRAEILAQYSWVGIHISLLPLDTVSFQALFAEKSVVSFLLFSGRKVFLAGCFHDYRASCQKHELSQNRNYANRGVLAFVISLGFFRVFSDFWL